MARKHPDEYRRISLEYAKGNYGPELFSTRPKKSKRKKKSAQEKAIERRRDYNAYINSIEWRTFRQLIFDERGRKCQDCGTIEGEMHLHHLTYKHFKTELSQDVKILCKICHSEVHKPIKVKMLIGWATAPKVVK